MNDYLSRIGYQPEELNQLNVIHVTGTKGKGSTSAFTDSVLRSLDRNSTRKREGGKLKIGDCRGGHPVVRSPSSLHGLTDLLSYLGSPGLYTSPHLVAVRERIRIDGVPLSEELFAKYFFEVWEKLESNPKVRSTRRSLCSF